MMQLARPQSTRRIRDRRCHPMLASHVERAVMVSFPLLFNSTTTIPNFFSQLLFPIKLLSRWPCRPPSLSRQGKQELPLLSPAHMLHRKDSDGEFSSQFYSPPHSTLFLTAPVPNLIAIPLAVQAALPQSIKGTRACHNHPRRRVS